MRPIDRGPVPLENGLPKEVRNYRDWKADLIQRLGNYCCYCNMTLTDSIQVEHVIAQDIDPRLGVLWDNMLLACGPCNRSKSNNPCPPDTHYLPQFHNTYLAFQHTNPTPHPRIVGTDAVYVQYRGLPANAGKSANTIQLCRLDRDTSSNIEQINDMRWKLRLDVLIQSALVRSFWNSLPVANQSAFIDPLIIIVEGKGFWGIWFDVFADVPAVRQALVERFPGTALNCFDTNFLAIPRNPNDPQDTL